MNLLRMLAVAAVLMAPSAAEIASFRTSFCPECWEFAGDESALDRAGRCTVCGRAPVWTEAVNLDWYWCTSAERWRRQPCAQDPGRKCCLRRHATAMVVFNNRSDEIFSTRYCPECNRFLPMADDRVTDRCFQCGKRWAAADAIYLRWYWCKAGEEWLEDPCPSHSGRRCCSERAGLIPVYSFMLPTPVPIPTGFQETSGLLVSTSWLEPRLGLPDLVVVHVGFSLDASDARGRAEYLDGHIPEARSLAWSDVVQARNGLPNEMPPVDDLVSAVRRLGVDENDRVILYDTGSGLEAARAFVALDYLGVEVALLDGHWRKWAAEGRSVSRMPAEFETSRFLPRLRPEILVSLEAVMDYAWLAQEGGAACLIDARAEAEYAGQQAGKGVIRPGHIPGAACVFWRNHLREDALPILRPEEQLRDLLESAGARPGRTLVVYCRTGVQASHTYFVARLLGYDVRLYDGSFVQWSGRPDLPVESNWARR